VVIEEWGKVRRVDSDEGDTIQTSSLGRRSTDKRDATFVRMSILSPNRRATVTHLDYQQV